jgi:hypothetical protein
MPLLLYCVLLNNGAEVLPGTGICGFEIKRMAQGELLAIYSEMERSWVEPKNFSDAALEFHNVVHAVFGHTAVIPFRFPTWLSSDELSKHLDQQSNRYGVFLKRHANHAQMELRIIAPASITSVSSGVGHLRARAAQLREVEQRAAELKDLVRQEVLEWRERDLPNGKRLYALVERAVVASFCQKLTGKDVRCSGPWPATEFLG